MYKNNIVTTKQPGGYDNNLKILSLMQIIFSTTHFEEGLCNRAYSNMSTFSMSSSKLCISLGCCISFGLSNIVELLEGWKNFRSSVVLSRNINPNAELTLTFCEYFLRTSFITLLMFSPPNNGKW